MITPFPEHSSVFLERYSEVRDFPNAPPPKKSGGSPGKRDSVCGGSWFPRTNAKDRSPGPRPVHGHLAEVGGVDPDSRVLSSPRYSPPSGFPYSRWSLQREPARPPWSPRSSGGQVPENSRSPAPLPSPVVNGSVSDRPRGCRLQHLPSLLPSLVLSDSH